MTATRIARDPKRIERLWRNRPAFAPQGATAPGPLTITAMKAWRVKEPVAGAATPW